MDFAAIENRKSKIENGFTLVELLVSMAVLTLLVMLVAQLMSSATFVTTASRKRMDADSQARMVFDRMANDFAKMVKRKDADCVFAKLASGGNSGQNDAMFFYSEAPAYANATIANPQTQANSTALIGYRINFNNSDYLGKPVLERLGKGLSWDGATGNIGNPPPPGGMVFLTTPSGNATPAFSSTIAGDGTAANPGNWTNLGTLAGNNNSAYADGTDSDYNVLSDQVYRLEIAFLLTDTSLSAYPVLFTQPSGWTSGAFYNQTGTDPTAANGSPAYAVGSRWYNTTNKQGYTCTSAATGAARWDRIGVQDVAAIIVAIAILDPNSRKIVSTSQYNTMVSALYDAETSLYVTRPIKMQMGQTWRSLVNGFDINNNPVNFATISGIPQSAASQVRIYQRYFYLNQLNK
jgi:prepilin-type N-terminal cleavage/methylation domain-containing protein